MSKFNSKKDEDKDDKTKKLEKPKSEEEQIKELTQKISDHDSILSKPPRTYQLNKDIFKIRLEKKFKTKQSTASTQLNQKLKDPTFFPSAPQAPPSS